MTDASTSAPAAVTPSRAEALREAVRQLGWKIDHDVLAPGDLAALRRARPGDLGGPAFWKLAVDHLEPAGLLPAPSAPWRDDAERRWVVIVAGMAEMAGQHARGRRLGRVLAEVGVSEARVLRLLRAEGEALLQTVRPIVHQLATAGARLDWTDLADLVTSDGRPWQTEVRRRIALDYYRTSPDRSTQASPEADGSE